MLIQVGNQPRANSVQSEFWSHGLFCKVRSQRSYDNWGYIRLWQGHPWQNCAAALQLAAEHRAQQCAMIPPDEHVIGLAISGAWVVFRYADAGLPIQRGYSMLPDRYWYRLVSKSTTSQQRRVVANLESMCCYLCSVMQSSTP